MKCKKHRRYNGKEKPDNNCYDCWSKFLDKGATYEIICEELEKRIKEDPSLKDFMEPAIYEFESIDPVTRKLRGFKWREDDSRM